MSEKFPNLKETFNKHHPDKRFRVAVRHRTSEGHDHDSFIGGIPRNTEYMTISLARGSWNSDFWNELEEAYENEGFETHLRKSSGTTRTRSGTCKHAKTQLYVW